MCVMGGDGGGSLKWKNFLAGVATENA